MFYLELFFRHILAKFKKNPWNGFFAKSQKKKKWQKIPFLPQMSGFRENGRKFQKIVRAMFLTFFTPNFMPSFVKILGAVSEIMHYGARTHGQT